MTELDLFMRGSWLPYTAGAVCVLIAAAVAIKEGRSFVQRIFAIGLGLLALEEIIRGLSIEALTPQDVVFWQLCRLSLFVFLPGTWLVFSRCFARPNYVERLKQWKYLIISSFVLPALIFAFFRDAFFSDLPLVVSPEADRIPLGMPGKVFYVYVLLASILILANLERTLRASIGRIRWQIKFVVLGVGVICAAWLYSSSQALLYSVLDTSLGVIQPVATLVACLLFTWGLIRSRFLKVDVYLSRSTIQSSLTVLLAGAYLVGVGLLAQLVRYFDPERRFPLDALLLLLALVGLAVLLFSDRIQERLKRFVIRHFKRPRYDYRAAWMELTSRTNSLMDVGEVCTEVSNIVSKTLGILSVNIWLLDESETRLLLDGSTVFTREQAGELARGGRMVEELVNRLKREYALIDLAGNGLEWPIDIMRSKPEFFADFKMRYLIPIHAAGRLLGIMSLNDDRVGKAPLSMEDRDLLNAYATQLAGSILQLRLSEQLRRARELEAFQKVSTFFVHDLKNLASRLSLTMQNLPVHFDNPEFRTDALRVIGQSVSQIDDMCSRLSLLKKDFEMKVSLSDLNEIVSTTLSDLEQSLQVPVEKNFQPLPKLMVDKDQIRKVLTNLLLNAREALKNGGRIRITTALRENDIVLSVEDNGCGMSRGFIEQSLFQPFRSTKGRGMGIGLYHSRMIVEAHHGRIEVDSQEGKGSIFRVILPACEELVGTLTNADTRRQTLTG